MVTEILDKIDRKLTVVHAEVMKNRVEIAKLKVRSSLWGGIAGVGGALVVLIWKLMEV